jgi:cell division transport system permease protein
MKTKNQKTRASKSGAQMDTKKPLLGSYFGNHLKSLRHTLEEQKARPVASFFTCSVIGIAILLPTLLGILLLNIYSADLDWDGSAQITLFLDQNTSTIKAHELIKTLEAESSIAEAAFIDKDAALEEFKALFKLSKTLEHLDRNPLPHSIVVKPSSEVMTLEDAEQLRDRLGVHKIVDQIQLDVMWVQRLRSISGFLERSTWLLALMLGFAVILILGNTVRLAIENKKDEIAVLKLVGGTDAFVCRPFLYMGIFFGLGGGLVAIVLCSVVLWILGGPIESLAISYQSSFRLSGLSFESTFLILFLGAVLGWFGAWLAVRRHINEIEPI